MNVRKGDVLYTAAEVDALNALIAEKDALLRSVSAGFTERGERIAKLEKAIAEHNQACQYACGEGNQEAVRCGYRSYFVNNGRRCSDCAVHWKIDVEALKP